jgi:hypothetical protein
VVPHPDDHRREPVNQKCGGAGSEDCGNVRQRRIGFLAQGEGVEIGRQPWQGERFEHRCRQRQRKSGQETRQKRTDQAMEEKRQRGEDGDEERRCSVLECVLRTGSQEFPPVRDQGGEEDEEGEPEKPAPGLLRADEPGAQDCAGPSSESWEEMAENKEADDGPAQDLRPAGGGDVFQLYMRGVNLR